MKTIEELSDYVQNKINDIIDNNEANAEDALGALIAVSLHLRMFAKREKENALKAAKNYPHKVSKVVENRFVQEDKPRMAPGRRLVLVNANSIGEARAALEIMNHRLDLAAAQNAMSDNIIESVYCSEEGTAWCG